MIVPTVIVLPVIVLTPTDRLVIGPVPRATADRKAAAMTATKARAVIDRSEAATVVPPPDAISA